MTGMRIRFALGLLALAALCTPAQAQANRNYAVKEMNFDLWCQLQANLPAERCDKRTAQDEASFQSYRAKVEAYEIPYLERRNSAARLDRNVLHNDPLGPRKNEPERPDVSTTKPPR